ncbi:MAG: DMT family transporter [Candidatus Saccharimonadales bacterium]
MWFYFAIMSAAVNAVSTIARRTHGSTAKPVELAWWTLLISLPCSIALLVIDHSTPWVNYDFLLPSIAAGTISAFAVVLLLTAYKYGETSAITPISNLLPIGLVISSFIFFDTIPTIGGLLGIILVVCGVYYSSVDGKHSLWHPFRSLWHQRGSRAMLWVVILWSISTNFQLMALHSASPAFLVLWVQLISFILLTMYMTVQETRAKTRTRVWERWWKHIVIMAIGSTLAVYFQNQAMVLLDNTSYVLAVKRLDVLIVILFCGLFLHEKHILKRFSGALVALAGIVVIYIFN